MSRLALGPDVLAMTSNPLREISEYLWERHDAYLRLLNTFVLLVLRGAPYLSQKFSEFDKGLVDNSNVTPSLSSLFLLSDPWHSSHSPSHRPSTPKPCALLMPLSRAWTASKLCRWLGGNVQRIQHSLFYTVINSHIMYTFIFLLG